MAKRVLVDQGLVSPQEQLEVASLGGGISSRVLRAHGPGQDFVLKQPLARFRVLARWEVSIERAAVEAEMAKLLWESLTPPPCPRLLAFDRPRHVLVFAAAPPEMGSWKSRLLQGLVEPGVAREAGRLLARIHELGRRRPELRQRFGRWDLFHQQRLEPYFETTARRHPDLTALRSLPAELARRRTTLIHGDFSPKNLLTDGRRVWILDHEVAAWGEPAFDVAFCVNHVLLKAVHRPSDATPLRQAARVFVDAYQAVASSALDGPFVVVLLGALLLARVDGKSPVEYLSEADRVRVRSEGRRLLSFPPPDLGTVLERWPPG